MNAEQNINPNWLGEALESILKRRIKEAVAEEREECAKLAHKFGEEQISWEGHKIAQDIRDRGTK